MPTNDDLLFFLRKKGLKGRIQERASYLPLTKADMAVSV